LFDSCSAVLFWGDYLVFIAEEWMNSRAGLYVVVKKEMLLPVGQCVKLGELGGSAIRLI